MGISALVFRLAIKVAAEMLRCAQHDMVFTARLHLIRHDKVNLGSKAEKSRSERLRDFVLEGIINVLFAA